MLFSGFSRFQNGMVELSKVYRTHFIAVWISAIAHKICLLSAIFPIHLSIYFRSQKCLFWPLKWLKMLSLPWKVVFSRYQLFLWSTHIFPKIFEKWSIFTKNDKNHRFPGENWKKTRFYTIWEPCFIYKCDFWSNWASRGVLQSLCGIFHFLAIFTHFDPQNVQNFGFFAIFSFFRDQNWAKNTKYGKFPHNVCKTSLDGQFGQKSHL